MKTNLYIALVVLAALTACAKVEPVVSPASQEKEIGFTVASHVAQTKADTPLGDDKTFKVYGIYTGSSKFASANLTDCVDYIPGTEMSKNGSYWNNATTVYYWPKGGYLSFAAYSPADAGLSYNRSSSSMFSQTEYELKQEDLLVAEFVADKTATNEAVPEIFHHALSQVNVNAKAGSLSSAELDFAITLNSVVVSGTSQTADFSWSTDNTMTWGGYATAADDGLGSTAQSLSTTDIEYVKGRFVIPQSLADAEMTINYTLVTKDGSGNALDTADLSATVSLNGTINTWVAGKSYTYSIVINPLSADNIEISPSVTAWVNVDSRITL